MNFDSTRIEQVGNNAVRDKLTQVEDIKYEVYENDKTTAIDGYIEVYPAGAKKKKPYLGRISLQVKASAVSKGSSYRHSRKDIECYLSEGGILFFFCEVSEDYREKNLYYDCLLPVDLREMLRVMKEKGTDSISRHLRLLPDDPIELRRIIEEFLENKFAQAPFVLKGPGDLLKLTAAGLKIKSLKMPKVPRRGNAGLTFDDFSNGGYLYATMQDGRKAVAIFESLASLSISRTEHVTSGDFASEMPVSTTMTAEFNTLNIGKVSISFAVKESDGQRLIRFDYTGGFRERVLSGRFVLALIRTGTMKVGNRAFSFGSFEFEPSDVDRIAKITDHAERISRILDVLHVEQDWDPSTLSDKELSDLSSLALALLDGEPVSLSTVGDSMLEAGLVDVNIQGATIRLLAIKESRGRYRLYDLFSDSVPFMFCFSKKETGEGAIEMPPLLLFSVEDYMSIVNFDARSFEKKLAGIHPTEQFDEAMAGGIVSMLQAYDAGARAGQKLLSVAILAAKAALEFNDSADNRINYWQAVARERKLTESEKDELAELGERFRDDAAVSAACSALIGERRNARLALNRMDPKSRSLFESWPIARFLKCPDEEL